MKEYTIEDKGSEKLNKALRDSLTEEVPQWYKDLWYNIFRDKMKTIGIVAMTDSGLIGKDNDLPWPRIQADMKMFQDTTKGHSVLMGRKTYESIPKKFRPLPGRHNIVITRDLSWAEDNVTVIYNKDELLDIEIPSGKLFIIGGAEIYKLFLGQMDSLLVSEVIGDFEGDTYFPFGHPKDISSLSSKVIKEYDLFTLKEYFLKV